jgi:uncharacterized protein (TIGR03083 family)
MTRPTLDVVGFIEALRTEGPKLVAAASKAGLDARVPSCPQWDVRELVRHVGGVHHWAAEQVEGRRIDEISGDLVDIVGGWPPDDTLLEWATERHSRLVRVFEEADPSFPYFTWMPGPTPLTMWARRQAHETAIHRVDAELAAGSESEFAAEFAADGVDELLFAMIGAWRKSLAVPRALTLHVHASDLRRTWTVLLLPDGFETHREAHGDAACTVVGAASAVYRAMWHRGGDIEVSGDASVLDAWWENVTPAWS